MEIKEIEEKNLNSSEPLEIDSNTNPKPKSMRTKVPKLEVHLYRQGKGPIEVFKSSLEGWDQNQFEVRDILNKYGFKSIYAFNPGSGRGAPIRFHSKNGRPLLGYRDGFVICIDGEPKVLDACLRALFGFRGTEDLADKLLDTPFISDCIRTKRVLAAPSYEQESAVDNKEEPKAFEPGCKHWSKTIEKHMPLILFHTSSMVGWI